jgi:hypothetical protein
VMIRTACRLGTGRRIRPRMQLLQGAAISVSLKTACSLASRAPHKRAYSAQLFQVPFLTAKNNRRNAAHIGKGCDSNAGLWNSPTPRRSAAAEDRSTASEAGATSATAVASTAVPTEDHGAEEGVRSQWRLSNGPSRAALASEPTAS